MIGTLHTYSTKWNICVNTETTKIVVFRNSAKLSTKEKWSIIMSLLKWLTVLIILG